MKHFVHRLITFTLIISLYIQSAFAGLGCISGFRRLFNEGTVYKDHFILKRFDRYKKYRQFLRPDTFANRKQKLLNAIEFWSGVAQRDLALSELKKTRAISLVQESMRLDSPKIMALQFRPLFYRVQMSFYAFKRDIRILNKLRNIKDDISKNENLEIGEFIRELKTQENYLLSFDYNLKTMNIKDFLYKLNKEITKIENDSIDQTIDMSRNFDEFSSALNTIQSYLSGKPKEQAKAKAVLELLKGENLVDYFTDNRIVQKEIEPVTVAEVFEIINSNPISRIIYLEKNLSQEKWTSIMSRLSVTQIHELTDLLIKRLPFLNNESIRSHIRYTVDNKEVLTHYPNIDRLVSNGKNSPAVMWEYMLSLDARDRGSEAFLRTFARRVDTRESWRAVKLYGKRRSEKLKEQGHPNDLEVKLYNKMLEMEVSINNLSPLAPWHRPAKTRAIRFLIDGILLAAFIGSSYYLVGSMVDQVQESEEESENEPTPIDELGFSPVELPEPSNPFSPISNSPAGNIEIENIPNSNPVESAFLEIVRQEQPEIIPTK